MTALLPPSACTQFGCTEQHAYLSLSVDSILPPVGATHVLVRATTQMVEWNAGTIVRLYSDALAVTNP